MGLFSLLFTTAGIALFPLLGFSVFVIVGLAPLLGLLGTVIGLIQAFNGLNIGDVGGTKSAVVSAGIAEALVTTAAGIAVATIALVTLTIFRSAYQSQMTLVEECGGQMELIHRCRLENSFVDGCFESVGEEV